MHHASSQMTICNGSKRSLVKRWWQRILSIRRHGYHVAIFGTADGAMEANDVNGARAADSPASAASPSWLLRHLQLQTPVPPQQT